MEIPKRIIKNIVVGVRKVVFSEKRFVAKEFLVMRKIVWIWGIPFNLKNKQIVQINI